ncbi:hypothetical protein Brsp06_03485 [Brucella sp. NBRC 13694]|uniref:hypothetical protein n=1 Tax=Brucella sp. NBRC 13694 TaxID=3075482 RepID=UPI0030B52ECB
MNMDELLVDKISEMNKEALQNVRTDVRMAERAVNFLQTYERKPDADHWRKCVLPVFEHLVSYDIVVKHYEEDKYAYRKAEYDTDRDFLLYMFDAFGNGEHCLIAKLRYK